jgi:hypothetical protein
VPKAPLTMAEKDRMIAWLVAVGDPFPASQLHGESDAYIIDNYSETLRLQQSGGADTGDPLGNLGGAISGIAQPITSTLDFLNRLADFLLNPVRLGELVVGVLLIGVGTKAVLSGSLSGATKSTGSQIKRGTQAYRYRGIPE